MSLRNAARRRNAAMQAQIREYEAAYALSYIDRNDDRLTVAGMHIPNGTPVHLPSTGPATIDRFVEQLHTDRPHVSLGPILRGRNLDQRKRKLAAFGNYAMERIAESEDRNIWTDVIFSLTSRGSACVRLLFDPDMWPEDEAERKYAWPFLLRSVHPSNVYLPPGHHWPYEWAIEEQQRFYGDLSEEYPSWMPAKQDDGKEWEYEDVVDVVVFWSDTDYILFAGGTEVTSVKNTLGIVPYVFGYSGFGHQSLYNDPATESIGLLHHSLTELAAEARLRTMSDALWQQSVWPTLIGTISEEEFKMKWSAGAGRYISVNDMQKEKPEWLEPVPISGHMLSLLPQLHASIEHATYSDQLTGEADSSIRSGTQAGMGIGQARARVDKVRAAVERMASRIIGIAGRYVQYELEESFPCGESTLISPTDIGNFDGFRVEFLSVDPAADSARMSTGLAPSVS